MCGRCNPDIDYQRGYKPYFLFAEQAKLSTVLSRCRFLVTNRGGGGGLKKT